MAPVLINSKQVGEMLGCSKMTVERLQKAGKLPFVRIGRLVRYQPTAIQKWIDSGGANAA